MKKNDEVKLNEKDYKASLIAQGGLNDFVRESSLGTNMYAAYRQRVIVPTPGGGK